MNPRRFRLYREPVCSCEERGWRRGVAFAAVLFLSVLAVRDCGMMNEAKGGEDGVRLSVPISLHVLHGIGFQQQSMPMRREDNRQRSSTETGLASWYGPGYHGRRTACGDVYDENAMTAAHRTLPCGTLARVCRTDREACVVVTITDRGPFIPGRVVDLSRAAMERIGGIEHGVVPVKVEVLP